MVDERAIALDNITSHNNKYKKLSDGTVIGVDILNDLSKYAELKLKRSYKIDISRWIVHNRNITNNSSNEIKDEIVKSLLQGKYNDNQQNKKLENKESYDIENLVILDDISLIEKHKKYITFNSFILITDNENKTLYLTPSIYNNDDPKEIAKVDNDLMILNKIFKNKHSKSIDDMVLNSFYKEINDKLDNIKNIILENSLTNDDEIKKLIKDDLFKKLFALYDIKKYSLINKNDSNEIEKEILKRANKLSALDNYKQSGGVLIKWNDINEIIQHYKKDVGLMRKIIEEYIPEHKIKFYNKDIGAIREVINEISSEVKALNDVDNNIKNNKLHTEMVDNAKENLSKLSARFDDLKDKITGNISDDINLKNKDSHPSKIFTEEPADLIELKNNTSGDKYALLFNYIEFLKNSRKSGGALLNKENEKVNQKANEKVNQMANEKVDENININYMRNEKERLKTFKELKSVYTKLVTSYYKIIDEAGEEEEQLNFLYDDLSTSTEDELARSMLLKFLKKNNDLIETYLKESIEISNKINDLSKPNTNNIDFKNSSLINNNSIKEYYDNFGKIENITSSQLQQQQLSEYFNRISKNIRSIIENVTKDDKKENKNDRQIKKTSTIEYLTKLIDEGNIDSIFTSLKSEIDKLNRDYLDKKRGEDPNIIEKEKETNYSNKKSNIDKRLKTLKEARPIIIKSLKILYTIINNIQKSNFSEYEEYISSLLNKHKLSIFESDENNSEHVIIRKIDNEITELEQDIKKLQDMIQITKRDKNNEKERARYHSFNMPRYYGIQDDPEYHQTNKDPRKKNSDVAAKAFGGEQNINEYIYGLSRQDDLQTFKSQHVDLKELLLTNKNNSDLKQKFNFGNFMQELKNNNKYLESYDERNNKNLNKTESNLSSLSSEKKDADYTENIYETIWMDYNNKLGYYNKSRYALSNIESNEDLHNKVIVNNLDPELVLKINFQDKAIFLLLAFIIRTISVVILEFLIEHNIIKTLQGSIVFYGFTYLFILFLVVFLVNYDSYKLRILLNYLNIHINASNLILQNILFIIFITLIFILVKSDDILKYFGSVFDYTNIYGSIYDYRSSFEEDSGFNLSHSEKLKLLYRTDILSMIIFIFTGFIVLIL